MWSTVTLYLWVCDGCGLEHQETDEHEPAGWVHGMDGLDRCPSCVTTARRGV